MTKCWHIGSEIKEGGLVRKKEHSTVFFSFFGLLSCKGREKEIGLHRYSIGNCG